LIGKPRAAGYRDQRDQTVLKRNFGAAIRPRALPLIEDVFRFTSLLLNFSRYKFISDRTIRRLSRDQPLFQKLLGIVTIPRPFLA
jgi:hypothetical protein